MDIIATLSVACLKPSVVSVYINHELGDRMRADYMGRDWEIEPPLFGKMSLFFLFYQYVQVRQDGS